MEPGDCVFKLDSNLLTGKASISESANSIIVIKACRIILCSAICWRELLGSGVVIVLMVIMAAHWVHEDILSY
jgi:hypothetical protein